MKVELNAIIEVLVGVLVAMIVFELMGWGLKKVMPDSFSFDEVITDEKIAEYAAKEDA